jgi:hypothetical protein
VVKNKEKDTIANKYLKAVAVAVSAPVLVPEPMYKKTTHGRGGARTVWKKSRRYECASWHARRTTSCSSRNARISMETMSWKPGSRVMILAASARSERGREYGRDRGSELDRRS